MIITVAGTKGGSGKSTSAVCLALEMASQGKNVLLCDLDPQGTATEWAPGLTQYLPKITSAAKLSALDEDGKIVIIDTPPGAAAQAVAAIKAAHVLVAVTGLGPGDMRALEHLCSMATPDLIIPVRLDKRRSLHGYALEALNRRWPGRIATAVPNSATVEWAQAAQTQLPMLSPPAIAYRSIVAQLEDIYSKDSKDKETF